MKLCVAYCRVSTDHDDQKNSIEAQKQYYTDLFSKKGYAPAKVGMLYRKSGEKEKVEGIFADEGISGTSLKNRKAFNTMIEYAKKKAFDVIYVKDTSRFSRSTVDGINVIKDLRELGVSVVFGDSGINTLDADVDVGLEIGLVFANNESRKTSDRVKFGMMRHYEKGGWNGSAPYGYKVENGFLQKEPYEAKQAEKIFDLYVNEGYGVYKIARYLNENNIPTRKGVQWSQKQIVDLIKKPIYRGEQRTHITESADINRHTRVSVEENEHIVHQFEHLRIIDDELFRTVQLEFKKRHDMFNRHTGHSCTRLLSSLIYCGHCGGNYKRKKIHSYTRKDGTSNDLGFEWTCSTNDNDSKICCSHRNAVKEKEITDQIKQEIISLKSRNLDSLFEFYLLVKFDCDINKSHYDDLSKQKDNINKQMQIWTSNLANDSAIEDIYKEHIKLLCEKLKDINAEMSRIKKHDTELHDARLRYKQYMEYINNVDIDNLSNAGLKKIFKEIIIKDVEKDGTKLGIMVIYDYYCLDMSFKELLDKADEMGFKVNKVEINSVEKFDYSKEKAV